MCFINRHSHHWGGTTAPSCGAHLVRSRKKESSDSVGSNGHEVSADDVRSIWEGYLNTSIFCTKDMYRYLYIYVCIFFCKYMCIYIYINQPTKACFYVSRTSHALILRGATRMSIEWVKVPIVVTDNFLEVEMKRWLLRSYVVVGGRHWDFDLSNAKQHL